MGGIILEGGVRYLEVKQLLLLSYCQAIAFYLLLKYEGHPVHDHPVIARLVEIKSLLDQVSCSPKKLNWFFFECQLISLFQMCPCIDKYDMHNAACSSQRNNSLVLTFLFMGLTCSFYSHGL